MATQENHSNQAERQNSMPSQSRPHTIVRKSNIVMMIQRAFTHRLELPAKAYATMRHKLTKIPHKKLTLAFIVGMVVLFIIAGYFVRTPTAESVKTADPAAAPSRAGNLTAGTPDFKTVLPTGKKIEDFGGWTRVSPPDRNPVFAYLDTIDTLPINVSQQPLPDDFKTDTAQQVELLAQGYQANKKLTVGSTIVFIGTSAKGPQSVILTKNNLLILIKSSVPIKDEQWSVYINSLD